MKRRMLALGIVTILLVLGVPGASASPADVRSLTIPSSPELILAIPDWLQVNSNGFGDPFAIEVSAVESFNGYLYAGTFNEIDLPPGQLDGAQIFRSQDGMNWAYVTDPGFHNSHDTLPPAILDMTVFNGYIYVGTGGGANASQIWRTQSGAYGTWGAVVSSGFADPDNTDVTALAEYGGKIYAGVTNQVSGPQLWSSFSGDSNSWTQVTQGDPGVAAARVTGFAVFDGGLYGAVEFEDPAQVWVSYGSDWSPVMNDGFGDSNNTSTGGMAVFANNMYVGAGNTTDGAHLFRTSDATNWFEAISPGFGDANNQKIDTVFVFQNQLYVSVKNSVTGMELWRSSDGTLWEQVNQDGFGDSNNTASNWSNATTSFRNHLYMGTSNVVAGGELWRMQNIYRYLPVIMR